MLLNKIQALSIFDPLITLWGHFKAPYFKMLNDARVASACLYVRTCQRVRNIKNIATIRDFQVYIRVNSTIEWKTAYMHGYTDNNLLSVKPCMLFFIKTLPRNYRGHSCLGLAAIFAGMLYNGSVQMYRKWFVFLQQSKISHFSFCNPTTSVLVIFCKSVSVIRKP